MAGTDGDLGYNFNNIDEVQLTVDKMISSDSTSSSDRQNMPKQELREEELNNMLEKSFEGMKEEIKGLVKAMVKEEMEDMTNALRKEREDIKDVKMELMEIQKQKLELQNATTVMEDLLLRMGAKELGTCAHEIWSRIMQEPRVVIGDGMQFFDPDVQDLVVSIAEVMGMEDHIPEMKEMSRIGIIEGEDAMHYSTLKSLENLVELCESVMEMFPSLQQSHAYEWSTVLHYWTLKECLPESFRD